VVILMQENRSFDHYFGSLKGVRGFGDRSTIALPGGRSVFQQPTTPPATPVTSTQYPWHLSAAPASAYPDGHRPPNAEVGAQGYGGTTHSWEDQHGAWYGGLMNGWVHAKGGLTTLGYLDRTDIPYQYALADAYTIGDAYHCSVLSATGPNRTFLWSGSINAGQVCWPASLRRSPGWSPTSSTPSTRTAPRPTALTTSARCSWPWPPTPTCSTPPS
jgi:phospholipase C